MRTISLKLPSVCCIEIVAVSLSNLEKKGEKDIVPCVFLSWHVYFRVSVSVMCFLFFFCWYFSVATLVHELLLVAPITNSNTCLYVPTAAATG